LDTSLLATIIGGIAAVVGLGMAAIAIIASRSTKAAQAEQPADSAGQNPNAAEGGKQMVSVTGSDNVADNVADNERTSLTDSNPATNDPNAFTDPFAPEAATEEDDPEVWGSVFDDPAEDTETKWGFAGEDATESATDDVRPGTKKSDEK
jgi:hypothetical protein